MGCARQGAVMASAVDGPRAFRRVASAAVVLLGLLAFSNIFVWEPQQTLHPDLGFIYSRLDPSQIAVFAALAVAWFAANLVIVRAFATASRSRTPRGSGIRRWDSANAWALLLGVAASGTIIADTTVGFAMYFRAQDEGWAPPVGTANALSLVFTVGGPALILAAALSIAVRFAVVGRHP